MIRDPQLDALLAAGRLDDAERVYTALLSAVPLTPVLEDARAFHRAALVADAGGVARAEARLRSTPITCPQARRRPASASR